MVGDVIGKYHPHGEGAIYDSLVRLAQDFAQRYPLVDGQGNFGNVDGDNAAAMRYTEARLSAFAQALLEGIDEDTVDFRPTYDGGDEEPVVLPAALPNLLANGTSGIAVGMATSIPPHNVAELCRRAVPDARAARHAARGAARGDQGAGSADRRHPGRTLGARRRGLPPRPRQPAPARPLAARGPRATASIRSW